MSEEEKIKFDLWLKDLNVKFESVMPEVHRQVKVYEEHKKNGTLKKLPE